LKKSPAGRSRSVNVVGPEEKGYGKERVERRTRGRGSGIRSGVRIRLSKEKVKS